MRHESSSLYLFQFHEVVLDRTTVLKMHVHDLPKEYPVAVNI